MEKLRRIPPLLEHLNEVPYRLARASAASVMLLNSTKHIGPPPPPLLPLIEALFLKERRLNPFTGVKRDLNSASVASPGRFPTYSVLHGGFWSAGLAGGGIRMSRDRSTPLEFLSGEAVWLPLCD